MRILWLDTSPLPWKQADGWEYLEQNSVHFVRVNDVDDALHFLTAGSFFDVIVIGAEMPGALEFLAKIKRGSAWAKTPTILVSAQWKKQDFKQHSTSPYAASNYAKLPMPADGFLDVICSLKGICREALAAAIAPSSAPQPPPFAPEPTEVNIARGGTEEENDPTGLLLNDPTGLLVDDPNPGVGAIAFPPIPEPPPAKENAADVALDAADEIDFVSDEVQDPNDNLIGEPYDSPMEALRSQAELRGNDTPWRSELEPRDLPENEEITAAKPLSPAIPIDESDVAVLRKYLSMREEELSHILREKNNLLKLHVKLEKDIHEFQKKVRELEHIRSENKHTISRLEKEGHEKERALIDQKDQAEFEKESLLDRVRYLETELKESRDKYSSLKDRVRRDIRKIQSREKELETRLELIKRDSETLIRERDKQVLELKRKIDAMEFDLDLIQDRKVQAESNADKYVDKISRVAKTLQVAFGMLEEDDDSDDAVDDDEDDFLPVIGGAAKKNLSADDLLEADVLDAESSSEGVSPGAASPIGATAVEALLKKKPEDLSVQEIEEAEAATQIFRAEDSSELAENEAFTAGLDDSNESASSQDVDFGEDAGVGENELAFDSLEMDDSENSEEDVGEAI